MKTQTKTQIILIIKTNQAYHRVESLSALHTFARLLPIFSPFQYSLLTSSGNKKSSLFELQAVIFTFFSSSILSASVIVVTLFAVLVWFGSHYWYPYQLVVEILTFPKTFTAHLILSLPLVGTVRGPVTHTSAFIARVLGLILVGRILVRTIL